MSAVSRSQYRFMQALAHNPELAKEHVMSTKQASEFVSENKGSKSYKKLPELKKLKARLKKGK